MRYWYTLFGAYLFFSLSLKNRHLDCSGEARPAPAYSLSCMPGKRVCKSRDRVSWPPRKFPLDAALCRRNHQLGVFDIAQYVMPSSSSASYLACARGGNLHWCTALHRDSRDLVRKSQ
ncbi:hypothetical protein CPB85DRAFT_939145 [Mucidula mucida]|nr:hypothetical protein CPB85DRAFT_939145 [Mucidula mucida]